jgi:rhodanese-related sulfurtransferase
MTNLLSRLSLNQKLALVAVALGVVAIGARPQAGHEVTIAPKDLAVMVQREVDHVTVRDLADWIVAGRADYQLIDLRTPEEYAAYHIPGAENVTVAALPDRAFAPTEKVVLYSDGGVHSAQAWFLLTARGARNAYILLGGLESWRDEVLFPRVAAAPTPFQKDRDAKLAQIAAHFGGHAVVDDGSGRGAAPAALPAAPMAGGGAPAGLAMPAVAPPAAVAGGAAAAPRKKKEGC